MDRYEYEQAALANLEQGNPASVAVAEVYATLALADEVRSLREEVKGEKGPRGPV